jgi:hypothetical protein
MAHRATERAWLDFLRRSEWSEEKAPYPCCPVCTEYEHEGHLLDCPFYLAKLDAMAKLGETEE